MSTLDIVNGRSIEQESVEIDLYYQTGHNCIDRHLPKVAKIHVLVQLVAISANNKEIMS